MIDPKKFVTAIQDVASAHQDKVLPAANAFRTFPSGEKNPYFTHCVWCASMLLLDTQLPDDVREDGAFALLYHDVLEDTSASLPQTLSPRVVQWVRDMTYDTFAQEVEEVLRKSPEIHLLKLYDKVATMYDGALRSFRYPEWLDFTEKLLRSVEDTYGELHIVVLGRGLVRKYRGMLEEGTIPRLPSEKEKPAV